MRRPSDAVVVTVFAADEGWSAEVARTAGGYSVALYDDRGDLRELEPVATYADAYTRAYRLALSTIF